MTAQVTKGTWGPVICQLGCCLPTPRLSLSRHHAPAASLVWPPTHGILPSVALLWLEALNRGSKAVTHGSSQPRVRAVISCKMGTQVARAWPLGSCCQLSLLDAPGSHLKLSRAMKVTCPVPAVPVFPGKVGNLTTGPSAKRVPSQSGPHSCLGPPIHDADVLALSTLASPHSPCTIFWITVSHTGEREPGFWAWSLLMSSGVSLVGCWSQR